MTRLTKATAIETLERRASYLRSCVNDGSANGFDFSEIAALDIAICALSETEKPLLNVKRRRKRAALQRRLEWLRSRPEEGDGKPFYLLDMASLEFAISTIDEHFLHVRPMEGKSE
jgi:hypothetical protein